jgi:hypothetical protein
MSIRSIQSEIDYTNAMSVFGNPSKEERRLMDKLVALDTSKIDLIQRRETFNEISNAPLFSQTKLSLTSRIAPDWLCLTSPTGVDTSDYRYKDKNKNIVEKLRRVFFESIKTILFFTLITPIFTFVADVIKFSVNRPERQKKEQELDNEMTKVDGEITTIKSQLKTAHTVTQVFLWLKFGLCVAAGVVAIEWPILLGLKYINDSYTGLATLRVLGRYVCPYINGTFGYHC